MCDHSPPFCRVCTIGRELFQVNRSSRGAPSQRGKDKREGLYLVQYNLGLDLDLPTWGGAQRVCGGIVSLDGGGGGGVAEVSGDRRNDRRSSARQKDRPKDFSLVGANGQRKA